MEFYYCFDWFVWEFGKCLLTPASKLLSGLFTELYHVLKVCERNSVQSLWRLERLLYLPSWRWTILPLYPWDISTLSEGALSHLSSVVK